EPRILAVGFFDPTPSHVVSDVDHRRKHLPDAPGTRLPRDRTGDAPHHRGVPAGGQPDRLRKHRGASGSETVQRLLKWDDRGPEAGAVHEVVLDGVDLLGVAAYRVDRGVTAEPDLQPEET